MIKKIIILITAFALFHISVAFGATIPDTPPNDEWRIKIIYRVLGKDNSYQPYVAGINHKGELTHMPEKISMRHVIPPEYEKPIQLNKGQVIKLYSLIAKAINSFELKPPNHPGRPHFIQWEFWISFKERTVHIEDRSNEFPATAVREALNAIDELRLSFQNKE
jgi:hypothetical protein